MHWLAGKTALPATELYDNSIDTLESACLQVLISRGSTCFVLLWTHQTDSISPLHAY